MLLRMQHALLLWLAPYGVLYVMWFALQGWLILVYDMMICIGLAVVEAAIGWFF